MVQVTNCETIGDFIQLRGTMSVDAVDYREGAGCIKWVGNGTPWNQGFVDYTPPVDEDWTAYDFMTMWIKSDNKNFVTARLYSRENWDQYIEWTTKLRAQMTDNVWTEATLRFDDYDALDAPFNLDSIEGILIMQNQPSGGETFRIDDIRKEADFVPVLGGESKLHMVMTL